MKKFKFNLSDDAVQKKLSPFASVVLGFMVGFVVLFLLAYNPVEGFTYLFQGGFKGILSGNFKQFGNGLLQMTPLVLTGLSVAFAFRTGLFNMGVTGQMLVG